MMTCLDACCRPSRRALLTAAAGAAATPALGMAAEPRRIIDVHHHFSAPEYVAARRNEILAIMPGFAQTLESTPEDSVAHLDANGVRAAILSVSAPGVWFGDDAESRRLARANNDYGAAKVKAHPDRLGLFAALPWPDVEGTLKEIEYAYDVLKADGVGFITSYAGMYPGEAKYMPIWEELNRRKAVVYFHPTGPSCCMATVKGLAPAALEFPYDTTRAIASLLMGLVFSKCPDIRFIFSHGGGALPMLADRLSALVSVRPDLVAQMRGGPLGEMRRLNFDTASVINPMAWAALTTLVPTSQVFFGTDFPFSSAALVKRQLQEIGVKGDDLAAINYRNAEGLFPRFARA